MSGLIAGSLIRPVFRLCQCHVSLSKSQALFGATVIMRRFSKSRIGGSMKKFFAGAAMLLTFVLCVAGLNGQSVNGTIGGTVQDSTGAFIPGVTITATNTLTGVATTSVSNESGAYQFPSLQPGAYTISAELPGFVTQRAKDYPLGGSAQARINFTMQVASSSTSIDVTVNAD